MKSQSEGRIEVHGKRGRYPPNKRRMISAVDLRSQLPASQWSMYDGVPVGEGRGESWDRKLKGENIGIWPKEQ